MGTFSGFFRVKIDPFLDPQKSIFGPPKPQKRVFGGFWTPPFPEHLRPKSTPHRGGSGAPNFRSRIHFPKGGVRGNPFLLRDFGAGEGVKNAIFDTPPLPPQWGGHF